MSFLRLDNPIPRQMYGGGGGGGGGGGMGGGGWISGLVGGIGAGAGVRGFNKQVNKQNKYFGQQFNPDTINAYARAYNPWIWNAIAGQRGNTGFEGDLYNIAQGKDISPWLLNKPLADLNRGATQNLSQFQSQVGRNNSGGGLSNFAALANKATLGGQRANLMNQYGQWREGQRRSDLDWLLSQVGRSQDRGWNSASAIADRHLFKKNFFEKMAAFGAGYAGATGGNAPAAPATNNNTVGGGNTFLNNMGSSNGTNNYGFNYGQFNNPNSSNNYGFPAYGSSIQTGS